MEMPNLIDQLHKKKKSIKNDQPQKCVPVPDYDKDRFILN